MMTRRRSHTHFVLLLSLVSLTGCGPAAFQVELVPARPELRETRLRGDRGLFLSNKIAVIDVDGLLINRRRDRLMQVGENPVSLFIEKLDRAAADKYVKAVVLRLNSPGGTVAATDIMHHRLREFRRTSGKPVVACMLGLTCSGAYHLACGCDGIMAQPTTVTGSIGTIMQTFSVAGTMEKVGVKAVTIKSGRFKDIASPLHDLSAEEQEVLQGMIDHFYEQFLDVVRRSRTTVEEERLRQLADGRVFTAGEALEEGLIDRVGYASDAVEWAKEMAGLTKAHVVIYHRPSAYKPNVYGSAASSGNPLGPLVNIDLPDWLNPGETQFLYLWLPGTE